MDASKYVGLPWADGGRGPEYFDCYGLVRWVYLYEYGIELPSLSEEYSSALEKEEVSAIVNSEPWFAEPTNEPKEGDVVVLRVKGESAHIGLVVEPGRMLHTRFNTGSIIESYGGIVWRHRVQGFLRWAG